MGFYFAFGIITFKAHGDTPIVEGTAYAIDGEIQGRTWVGFPMHTCKIQINFKPGLRIRIRIRTFLVGSGSGAGKFSPDPDPYPEPDPIGTTLAM